ncbi:MAG: nucleotide-binding universal stress UspA family protein [Pseudomonas sp.]|jgi:nucleotide-binding universal stress UspA family protein
MHKVLLATDGSVHAARAASYLVNMIEQDGLHCTEGDVHVLNVQAHLPTRISQTMAAQELCDYYSQHSDHVCAGVVAQLQQAGIAFVLHKRVGAPASNIVACASEVGCQSVLIGTHGAGLALGVLLGSVVSEVVKLTTVPVTLVK